MKIIIAPSKTMKYKDYSFKKTPLIFPKENQYLYSILQHYNDEDLCETMKISYKQALQVYDYYQNKQTTYPALSLYQGTVFKQLEISKFQEHLQYLDNHVRIMSAFYGVLKYNSDIAPYRLDMTMKLSQVQLYEYWYTPIYQYFEKEDFIISLASKEFTDMIHHPHLFFIDFVEFKDKKAKRNAMIIKKARGQMLNQMILKEIKSLDDLKRLNIEGFTYQKSMSQDNRLVFSRYI